MGGTSLFGWLEPCHFDQEAAYHLLNRAQNGVGLVLPGMQCVRDTLGIPGRHWLYQNEKMFKELADYMPEYHRTGSKLFIQLAAGFGRSMAINGNMVKMLKNPLLAKLAKPVCDIEYSCASASATPNRWYDEVKSRPMTVEEIQEQVDAFGKTARMLREAGIDGVEIHAVHEGYLLDQFTIANMQISPHSPALSASAALSMYFLSVSVRCANSVSRYAFAPGASMPVSARDCALFKKSRRP